MKSGRVIRGSYGQRVEDFKRRRRGIENEARTMAIYLSWQLGGHKHSEIGKALGLDNESSVSSACLRMKLRVAQTARSTKGLENYWRADTKLKADLTPFCYLC